MNIKEIMGEGSEGIEEIVIENWRKGNPCDTAAEHLVELHHKDTWKAVHLSNELEYLEEIS